MTIWRGYQRFVWRKDLGRQVSWLYLLCGIGMLLVMGLHGSLGAWLASDFRCTSPQTNGADLHCHDQHWRPQCHRSASL